MKQIPRLFPWLLLVTSLALTVGAAIHLVAELWVNPARHLIQHIGSPATANARKIDEESWSHAISSLQSARFLVPGNAEYHMWNAWLHQRRAEGFPPWSDAAKTALRVAETSYGDALRQRPSWGLLWINRAQVRVRLGSSPDLAMADLQRAVHFDPRNPHVVKQAIRLGFVLWHGMDPEERRGFLYLIRNNVHRMPYDIIDLARRHGLLDTLRPLYATDPKLKELWERKLGAEQ
ncbi:MAG: hypothetical protein HQL76_10810 [Magnetococcales bacterium]|nr:hypothetical protein [Magnetococcales bacterium]